MDALFLVMVLKTGNGDHFMEAMLNNLRCRGKVIKKTEIATLSDMHFHEYTL